MPKHKYTQALQIKCHAAAYHFAKGVTSAADLAEILDVTHESVRRWAKRKEFHTALDRLGYTGKRTFSRKHRNCRQHADFDLVVQLYKQLTDENVPRHKRISEIESRLGNRHTGPKIRYWIRKVAKLH